MARTIPNIVYLESPEKGVDGRGILSGARDPLMTDGRLGDFWINTVSKHLFGPKNAGEWPDKGLIRGAQGWAPVLVAEADSTRRVFKIADWTGGEGAKPATGYLAADGSVVADIADAADFRGVEGPQALINALDEKADAVTYETLTALAESATDNEKAPVKRVFEAGGKMPFRSRGEAQVSSIPAQVKRIDTQFFAPSYLVPATLVGGASYRRVNQEPTHAMKLRSADRFTADDGLDSANGGWWEIDESVVEPTMAGAILDNSADTAPAINACFSTGRDVRFTGGTYRVAGQCTLVNKKNVRIFGDGVVNLIRSSASAVLVLDKDCTGCIVEGLSIDANKANFPAPASGIVVFGPFNTIERCTVINPPGHGIIFSNTFVNPIYSKALFNMVVGADQIGITLTDGHYSTLLGNHVENCTYEGITVDSGAGVGSDFCVVDGNTVRNCLGGVGAIGLEGSFGSRVVNNLIDGGVGGVVFQNNINPSTDCVVANNVILNTSGPGLWLKSTGGHLTQNCTFSGNICRNTAGAITIETGSNGNSFVNNELHGGAVSDLGVNNTILNNQRTVFKDSGEIQSIRPTNGTHYGNSIFNTDAGISAIAAMRIVSDAGALALLKHNAAIGGFGLLQCAAGDMFYDSVKSGGAHRWRVGSPPVERMAILSTKLDLAVPIEFAPGSSVTPTSNGDVVFELTSNAILTVKARGSDGAVRSATLSLA